MFEWLKVKKIGDGKILSPQQLEEQQHELEQKAIEAYKATLTPDFVKEKMPDLFHATRILWLKSFHIEDLEQSQEVSSFMAIFPYIQLAVGVITLLLLFTKK